MTATRIAKIVVEIRTKSLNRPFDYLIPQKLVSHLERGMRVLVSFGRQVCQGYVVELSEPPEMGLLTGDNNPLAAKLKPILAVLDTHPILSDELLALCEWLTDRYVCTMLEAIQTVLPGSFRTETKLMYRRVDENASGDGNDATHKYEISKGQAALLSTLEAGPHSAKQLAQKLGPDVFLHLPQAVALGLVEEVTDAEDKVSDRFEVLMTSTLTREELTGAALERERRAPKQAQLVQRYLELCGGAGEVPVSSLGVRPSDPAVSALVRDKVVHLVKQRVFRDQAWLREMTGDMGVSNSSPELTSWQQRAVVSIDEALSKTASSEVLLHGVTGSGKTEVYMRAIAGCLDIGRTAVVLVPEISLTPQMVTRFTSRFGNLVAVLHSGLSAGERKDAWVRIEQGDARVVIGARSAVFAPLKDLGLIIIDEEHEPSYKQDETPFYDAREVARWRSSYNRGTVIYGSATPSLEVMTRAESGQVAVTLLPERINRGPMPPVQVVDMREELKNGNRSLFSSALASGIEECVEGGHQAILFLNRRGYSAFLLCRNCGERIGCPNCDIALTLHRGKNGEFLRCHYCQYTTEVPMACPACKEPAMRPFGIGTQQVEEQLHERWPHYKVLRMDVDTTRRKGAHHQLIQEFEQGDAQVLLGTQMVAKGLDFPNVAFVGVISADTMLAVPDYRANERTFNLLTQVAGRAGRGDTPGRSVIQTYQPEHYAIACAAHHDYGSFYRREKQVREAFQYPPFRELALFLATHEELKLAEGAARRFERELTRQLPAGVAVVLPASPSGIGRVENRYRFQVVVKYCEWDTVKSVLQSAYALVTEKMVKLGGTCVLDVAAGRM